MERFLVIQHRQLGDILLTTPVLRELRRERPDAEIVFLTHPMGRLIADGNPFLTEHWIDANHRIVDTMRLVRKIRAKRFDVVFDFMNNPRSALLTVLSGATSRIGFQGSRSLAYTATRIRPRQSDYIVREKFDLLRAAGLSPQDERLTLPWGEADARCAREMMAFESFAASPLRVILSPTHRREPRRWPLENWATLARNLVERHQACVLWVWGPGEEPVMDAVLHDHDAPGIKAPPTKFRELAALIANSDLMIANSNGPSHVAVAVGTPSLQLHGPTEAAAWCPQSRWHRASTANDSGDMATISVAAALDAIERMLPSVALRRSIGRPLGLVANWRDAESLLARLPV